MKTAIFSVLAAAFSGIFAPALATEHEVSTYGAVLEACYSASADTSEREACIGEMAAECMETEEGGYSTLGMSSCVNAEAKVWDRFLNAEYQSTLEVWRALDKDEAVTFPEFAKRVEALRDAQRAWIAFRDAECNLAYAEWGSGSMRHTAWADCTMTMTAERAIELRAMREKFE